MNGTESDGRGGAGWRIAGLLALLAVGAGAVHFLPDYLTVESQPADSADTAVAAQETAPAERAAQATAQKPAALPEVAVKIPDDAPVPILPGFDLVRAEPDGETLIAGRAEPRARVGVLLDALEIADTQAGRDGAFVLFVSLGTSADLRVLSLESMSNGVVQRSQDQIILAPTPTLQMVGEAQAVGGGEGAPVPAEDAVVALAGGGADALAGQASPDALREPAPADRPNPNTRPAPAPVAATDTPVAAAPDAQTADKDAPAVAVKADHSGRAVAGAGLRPQARPGTAPQQTQTATAAPRPEDAATTSAQAEQVADASPPSRAKEVDGAVAKGEKPAPLAAAQNATTGAAPVAQNPADRQIAAVSADVPVDAPVQAGSAQEISEDVARATAPDRHENTGPVATAAAAGGDSQNVAATGKVQAVADAQLSPDTAPIPEVRPQASPDPVATAQAAIEPAPTRELVADDRVAADDTPETRDATATSDDQRVATDRQVAQAPLAQPQPVQETLRQPQSGPDVTGAAPRAPAATANPAPRQLAVQSRPAVPGIDSAAPSGPATPAAAGDRGGFALLKTDSAGVELLQRPSTSAPAGPAGEVVLDTISYANTGAVLLSGRSRARNLVRVYLNNRPVIDLSSGKDGRWRGALPDVDPGIYTLRLDELSDLGEVVSRLETPFKREAPEILIAARQDAAAAHAPITSITVQAGDTLWAISRAQYGRGFLYVRVFEANRDSIRNPDLIYPGQIFSLPE